MNQTVLPLPGKVESEENNSESADLKRFLVRAVLAGALPLFTGIAYLIGVAYHQTYLSAFRIPSGLFNKTTTEYFLYAYIAITESSVRLLGVTGLTILAIITLSVYVWNGMSWLEKRLNNSRRLRRVREHVHSKPAFRLLGNVVLVPLLVAAMAYLLLFSLFLFILPGVFGGKAGRYRAEKDLAAFKLGCESAARIGHFCNEVLDGGKPTMRGFTVDISDKYFALYEAGMVRVIPVGGKEFASSFEKKCIPDQKC